MNDYFTGRAYIAKRAFKPLNSGGGPGEADFGIILIALQISVFGSESTLTFGKGFGSRTAFCAL